jgi:hypothetical protein
LAGSVFRNLKFILQNELITLIWDDTIYLEDKKLNKPDWIILAQDFDKKLAFVTFMLKLEFRKKRRNLDREAAINFSTRNYAVLNYQVVECTVVLINLHFNFTYLCLLLFIPVLSLFWETLKTFWIKLLL